MKDVPFARRGHVEGMSLDAIAEQSQSAAHGAGKSVARIRAITRKMNILALNAKIEAAKAGAHGRGFAVVAHEVGLVGSEIDTIAQDIQSDLSNRLEGLNDMVAALDRRNTGQRLMDMAFMAVDTMDRSLYERTCDVRWWATDPSFANTLCDPNETTLSAAADRLAIILRAYSIYADLWICDAQGTIVANAQDDFRSVIGRSVGELPWFREAMTLNSADDYAVGDVVQSRFLQGHEVITYACAIRENSSPDGRILGVLAANFDWRKQAASVVKGVRIDPELARKGLRVMLVDRTNRVIAASDDQGILSETLPIPQAANPHCDYYSTEGALIGYHETEGFESYRGLGWKGVVIQTRAD